MIKTAFRLLFGRSHREKEGARLMASQEVQHASLMRALDDSAKETLHAAKKVERAGEELLRRLQEDFQ